jgi:DNA invertase Pin-like site-specific DNA recombinase
MVAVWKIDRLSRTLSHLLTTFEKLQDAKVSFFSLKENIDFSGPIGRLTFQIFGALAEFERETIMMPYPGVKNCLCETRKLC